MNGIYCMCVLVHICMERNCSDALRNCLQWIEENIRRYNLFREGDRYGNTVLHAGMILTNNPIIVIYDTVSGSKWFL